jgi:hypothetical protein
MTDKEKGLDIKAKDDIKKTGSDAKVDAKSKHIPYDGKGDTKNPQNTVQNR